jgi:multidrug resistance efflux pump
MPAPATDPAMAQALEAWRQRLAAAGVAVRAVACAGGTPEWTQPFADPALHAAWDGLVARVDAVNPVALGKREGGGAAAELLLASRISLPDGQPGVVGVAIAPPHHERLVPLVLLSLGGLQLALSSASLVHNQRAARLLEVLGHVASQDRARSAAQEWINRSAAWVRAEVPALASGFTLALFEVRSSVPRWWVAADTAWAETASPVIHEAAELAAEAVVEARDVATAAGWACPVLAEGLPVAVLVARCTGPGGGPVPVQAQELLRANLGLAEPLLRHWRLGDRSLPRHALDVLGLSWRRITGPGHLVWKAGAGAVLLAAVALLLVPVADRVTAATVIEGRLRQVVTAPFQGFVAQVLVRPGEPVRAGQLLARLDDRDLLLEQARYRSERDQAAGKLRQAMAERDPAALALAGAELRQAESQLALVEARLARAALLAPIDGLLVTGDWAQQVGSPVEAGKEMFEVAAADGYRVVLHVADADIARVRVGQSGVLRLAGQPQVVHRFTLARVTATASVQEGVNGFRVEAAWVGATPALSPGMQGVGKVTVGESNLLTIWTRSSIDWLRLKLWSWWW